MVYLHILHIMFTWEDHLEASLFGKIPSRPVSAGWKHPQMALYLGNPLKKCPDHSGLGMVICPDIRTQTPNTNMGNFLKYVKSMCFGLPRKT